jgi:acyl-CoA synthetase (AMP-forming)/AMP-acid ligase II
VTGTEQKPREASPIAVTQSSLPALLRERASQQPDAPAYTYIDYEIDPAGFAECLTWAQVHHRALVVAEELRLCGSVGDRAAILAPQGLDYIVAFLGALQAGFIAVPLPLPQFRIHDQRVSSALRDCSPSVILTTSHAVDDVINCARDENGRSAVSVVEIDLLDLDSTRTLDPVCNSHPGKAYLQYTSGSTRQPAGVIVSHHNVIANLEQAFSTYFEDYGNMPPPGLGLVSWLPFHHDMGLFFTIFSPMFGGNPVKFMRPESFLQRPARWMQLLGEGGMVYSCAPNFAFDLAARRTSDKDMTGLDLGDVLAINNGSERVHSATIKRFTERFARFNLEDTAVRPSYGLAEATLFVASTKVGRAVTTVRFDSEHLSSGQAKPCGSGDGSGTAFVSYGPSGTCMVRIVNPDTGAENPSGTIGEIWVHGDNVAMGYWQKPLETKHTFGGTIVDPSPGTPAQSWLRTGDVGVMCDGELFIMGRIKDVLIVDGRNHYPEDIEATIQEITAGRVAAISVPDARTEQLVTIVEFQTKCEPGEDYTQMIRSVRREIISAVGKSHDLRVSDLVLVPPGSIPVTTSGKIRRSACVDSYLHDEFKRVDVPADLLSESW